MKQLSSIKHTVAFSLKPIAGFCLSLTLAHTAMAANLSVNGIGTRAEALNAFVAVADDPSAIYYNPAGLTQIKHTEIDTSASIILPEQTYTNTSGVETKSTGAVFGGNLLISHPLNNKLSLGFGVYSPFARQSSYGVNAATGNNTMDAKIMRMDFVPTIAYQIQPNIAIGGGLVAGYVTASDNILGFDTTSNGWGYTAQGGVLFKLPKQIRLGVNYRGPMKARLHGHASGTYAAKTGPHPLVGEVGFSQDIRFPGTLSAGISVPVNDKVLLSFEYDYEMWSYFDKVVKDFDGDNPDSTTTVDAKDSSDFRFGVRYTPHDHNEFSASYAYVEHAVPYDNLIAAKPDYDQHSLSVGYSYYWGKFRFDAGYQFLYMPTGTSNSTAGTAGDYKMHANMFMLGLGYTMT